MDLDSKNGFISSIWGPATWHYLHTMSFTYPNHPTDVEKHDTFTFVMSLCNVLPCRACREGLVKNLERVPLRASDLKSRVSFAYWLYRLHNEVNRMLKRPTELSFVQVCSRYIKARAHRLCILRRKSPPSEKGSADHAYDAHNWTCDADLVHAITAHNETHHEKWSDSFWLFVHCVSLNYPSEPTCANVAQYQQFFTCLILTIPPSSKWTKSLRSIAFDRSSKLVIGRHRFDILTFEITRVRKVGHYFEERL